MKEFLHMFIPHGGSFVNDKLTKHEWIVLELKCDVDKGSYFGLVDIIKELRST